MASSGNAVPAWHGRFQTRIERACPDGRLIAISDIHGRADLLDTLLERLNLQKGDLLVVVGDVIERGSENLRALRRVMQLQESGQAVVLMGNVDGHRAYAMETDTDEMDFEIWKNIAKLGSGLFMDMCRELGLPCASQQDVRAAKPHVRRAFAAELSFMTTRPTILDTPGWTLVHGGLPRPDFEALEGGEAFDCMKFNDYIHLGPACAKPTAVGHYPVNLYRAGSVRLDPYWCAEKNVLSIDGGCGLRAEAQLNAALLERDGSFSSIYADGLPVVTALDRQEEQPPTARFCWPWCTAQLVERRTQSVIVKQAQEGRRYVIPNLFVDEEEGEKMYLNDISDAHLAVQPGDVLSLIARTEDGLYVKKNGMSGWYFGAVQEK